MVLTVYLRYKASNKLLENLLMWHVRSNTKTVNTRASQYSLSKPPSNSVPRWRSPYYRISCARSFTPHVVGRQKATLSP